MSLPLVSCSKQSVSDGEMRRKGGQAVGCLGYSVRSTGLLIAPATLEYVSSLTGD